MNAQIVRNVIAVQESYKTKVLKILWTRPLGVGSLFHGCLSGICDFGYSELARHLITLLSRFVVSV